MNIQGGRYITLICLICVATGVVDARDGMRGGGAGVGRGGGGARGAGAPMRGGGMGMAGAGASRSMAPSGVARSAAPMRSNVTSPAMRTMGPTGSRMAVARTVTPGVTRTTGVAAQRTVAGPTARAVGTGQIARTRTGTGAQRLAGRPGMMAGGRGGAGAQQRVSGAVRNNPRLANAHRNAMNNPRMQRNMRRDWNRFGRNRWGAFNAGLAFDFMLLSPWFLFPFGYYNYYWTNYTPCLFYRFGFGYPCYWDYGYAREIQLVDYGANNRWDDAIARINQRLDELTNELANVTDEDRVEELKAQIAELKWYIADINKYKSGNPPRQTEMAEMNDEEMAEESY